MGVPTCIYIYEGSLAHITKSTHKQTRARTAKALLQAAQARVNKHRGAATTTAAATTTTPSAAPPAPATDASAAAPYSLTAALGLTLLVDAEAAVRGHLESVLALARGLNGLTLQVGCLGWLVGWFVG